MIIVIACALIICFIGVFGFNRLNTLKQTVDETWSDVNVQLKRRHDLIPNLVATVQGYAKHETNLFDAVTKLRTQAMELTTSDITAKSNVEQELATNLKSVVALAENYPDLKANTNFLKLQDELTETEDEIASSRRIFNTSVADYNTTVKSFPTNLIAQAAHFTPASFFQNTNE